jgi:hypothetical protein
MTGLSAWRRNLRRPDRSVDTSHFNGNRDVGASPSVFCFEDEADPTSSQGPRFPTVQRTAALRGYRLIILLAL